MEVRIFNVTKVGMIIDKITLYEDTGTKKVFCRSAFAFLLLFYVHNICKRGSITGSFGHLVKFIYYVHTHVLGYNYIMQRQCFISAS